MFHFEHLSIYGHVLITLSMGIAARSARHSSVQVLKKPCIKTNTYAPIRAPIPYIPRLAGGKPVQSISDIYYVCTGEWVRQWARERKSKLSTFNWIYAFAMCPKMRIGIGIACPAG